jgi:sugar lactone lactonase YvrE
MLADAATKTLWTCQLTPIGDAKPVKRHTALRGFDLSTGNQKLRWDLPGENSTCNDFSVGPDKALYITDTANASIYRLAAGASTAELFLEDSALLRGIDGITFLDGTLYVNNVSTSKLYRIPMDAASKAGRAVEISLDQPVKGPDGMRAAKGKLLVAENGSGKISVITVHGDKATVTVIMEGLKTPTAVEPDGDTIWIAERGAGKALSIPMPK